MIFVGCCGWTEARARYFQHFPAVELQETFYHPPTVELASKWRHEAPPGFRFLMKAWQLITHAPSSHTYRRLKMPLPENSRDAYGLFRPTEEVRSAWDRTLAVARALDAVAIVFQCPASFRPEPENIANLESFFKSVEHDNRLLAWEPRGAWPVETVRAICRQYGLVHCTDPFQAPPVYGDALYFRLHGVGAYRYQYSDAELLRLREMLEAHSARPAYVMFNNVHMKDDALRFKALLFSAPPRLRGD